MLNHIAKFQDEFFTINFSMIVLSKGDTVLTFQKNLYSPCKQILFKLLLNIQYSLFKITVFQKNTPCILLYIYLCRNILHIQLMYLT